MGGYWTGHTKILLLVGIPCIVTTYTIAVVPCDILYVTGILNSDYSFGYALRREFDVRAWLGIVIIYSLLILYFIVSHIMLCCKSNKGRNIIIYCYLSSIGAGYCAFVDLFFCLLTVFGLLKLESSSLMLMGQMYKYASLSVGVAWLFTVTAGALLLNTESTCLQALAPVIGSLISFGLSFFIVVITGAGYFRSYTPSDYLTAGFVLAFISLACYLVSYFAEFQKKKILHGYDVFDGSAVSFGRVPTSSTSSTTMLSNTHDSSMYRGYQAEAYSYA
ncbi:Hypothetical protein GSB_150093 [Giardia duodenalis]|uniref:MARVEL domain-containing protein n=2 Tax=Giardia intestinalis TaxID=5741 RepID=C6LNS4_GIAIB|nr:Hypothetical protein GL50581_379 [Giardia intestinalis ATCC 50581]ESU45384.1 Hypothetical protein GSB_150093 [Giardia intestinalis]